MNTFVLCLQSATQYERVENVASFIGQDASGSFGVLPGHARMMSLLTFGLVRFRTSGGNWEYLAVPGAVIYFVENQLFLNTRRYVRGGDYDAVRASLRQQFLVEERELRGVKQSLQRLEEEMFKRLLDMSRGRFR
jgi:F-type H+-transporting ATPase subunit epsilon